MTFNSYQRVTAKKNRFLYNDGTERISELDLGVDFTDFRIYDPAVSRWWQIDPIEKFHESPYAWVTNNPILWNDPFGLDTLSTSDKNFNWDNVKPGDVVDGTTVTEEVVVTATQEEDSGIDMSGRQSEMVEGRPWPYEGKAYYNYHERVAIENVQVASGVAWALIDPIEDYGATPEKQFAGGALNVTSRVKRIQAILKMARKVGQRQAISREINQLLKELVKGNVNAGMGSKSLGFGGVFEMRGRAGARIYFRNVDNGIEILAYSDKPLQNTVIKLLRSYYE